MRDSNIEPLKRMAEKIVLDGSGDELERLNKAFQLISQETERIENAYNSLKEEFTSVHFELEEAGNDLKKKIVELDVLNSYLQNILANISQGLIFIDLNGDVTTYNSASEKILEVPEKEVLNNNFWKSFPDDIFGFSMRLALAAKNPPPSSFSFLKDKEGNKKELEITANFTSEDKAKNLDHNILFRRQEGIIVLIRDITEMRSLQLQAARSDRLKELGEMAAEVAHEIRNPLGGIKGFASLLKRDLADDKNKEQMADYIVQGTDALNRLVTKVLTYARPIDIKLKKIPLNDFLPNLLESIKADETVNPKILFELNLKDEKLLLLGDPELLKGALLNLIMNAMQAMPEGGTLALTAGHKKGAVFISIKDTGIGIRKENLEKIFSPFFTTKEEGNGFGLSEVYKVIQAHGGEIEVESEVSKGSVFTLKLPQKN